jgi:EAL domain-containing protein (putative c-di-GMP-specific phosphodiesterase class I)
MEQLISRLIPRLPGSAVAVLRGLDVAVQPLVSLTTTEIAGYEALARPAGSQVAPATLFEAALAGGWMPELELVLAGHAFDAAVGLLAPGQRLFLNVHPTALESRGFAQRLRGVASKEGLRLTRVVVEITEQGPITNPKIALANIEELREAGALFALDDFGSGYAHMRWLREIRPRFIKVAQSIATDFERVPWRRSVVQSIQSFAKEVGCTVIVEGVETAATAEAALEMGIELGQGYYFGRPAMMPYSSGWGTSPSAGNSFTSMTASTSPS